MMVSIHQEQRPLVRSDVERLLQQARNAEQVDLSGHNLQAITLVNVDLRRANLSLADLRGATLRGRIWTRPSSQGHA